MIRTERLDTLVSEDDFKRYVNKQMSGECNMWSTEVERDCHLTEKQHMYIISHYSELREKYL